MARMMIRGGDLDLVEFEFSPFSQPLGLRVAVETKIDNRGMVIGKKKT